MIKNNVLEIYSLKYTADLNHISSALINTLQVEALNLASSQDNDGNIDSVVSIY